ncbi:MAG: thrombospondin type 3 repeat-containing protein, partial [Nanoarchaeota archaeon]|nr:thrombospondin type 3 repeat-containing protein [Nanoarchaeota archaeon]
NSWEKENGLNYLDYNDNNKDPDKDSLTNFDEYNLTKRYGKSTDPNKADTDGDDFDDGTEVKKGTNPLDPNDFPKEEVIDLDKDSDNDGIPDQKEKDCSSYLNPLKADADKDFDQDGLTNKVECMKTNTNPKKADTDGDGFSDGEEYNKGTSPLDPNDKPKAPIMTLLLYGLILIGISGLIGIFFITLKKGSKKKISSKISKTKDTKTAAPKIEAINKPTSSLPGTNNKAVPTPNFPIYDEDNSHIINEKLPPEKPMPQKYDTGDRIFHKRRLVKIKKRNRFFDVFDDTPVIEKKEKIIKDKKSDVNKVKKVVPPPQWTIFERLNNIVTENKTFRKLEIVLKKKPATDEELDSLAGRVVKNKTKTNDKLDRLIMKKGRK